jgi:hypothetical protein
MERLELRRMQLDGQRESDKVVVWMQRIAATGAGFCQSRIRSLLGHGLRLYRGWHILVGQTEAAHRG